MATLLQNLKGQFGKYSNQALSYFNDVKKKADEFLPDFAQPETKQQFNFDSIRQKTEQFVKNAQNFQQTFPERTESALQKFEQGFTQKGGKLFNKPGESKVPGIAKLPRFALSLVGADPQSQRDTREAEQIINSKFNLPKYIDPQTAVATTDDRRLKEVLSPEEYLKVKRYKDISLLNIGFGTTAPTRAFTPRSLQISSAVQSKSDPVTKIINLIGEAKPMRGQQEALYSAERAARAAKISSIGKKVPGEKGFYAQLGQLKGELPKVQFERIRQNLTQGEVDSLFNKVESVSELMPFEKITTKNALAKLLDKRGGQIPTESELNLLSKVFPPELVKAIESKQPLSQRLFKGIGEVFNIPRSIMASFDLSAPLRQGVFLVGRPKQWFPAFKEMFKYAFNESAYDDLFKQISKRETYPLMREANLALTDLRSPSLTAREEAFMSNMAQKIPGAGKIIRGSDRAYTGFLNKLRADTFDDLVKNSKLTGIPQTSNLYSDIARFVNSATGRGQLGAFESSAVLLNSTLFSPRLMASRLNLLNPNFYIGLNPFVRKEALKSLLGFAGLGLSALTLAKMAGADVGADPRSADFGKIKIGNTRYDTWGGFQQYIKLAGQLITGEVVSSTTGKVITLGEGYKPLTRKDIILRFFESKESPVASFVTSLLTGQTPTGEPTNVTQEVAERFIPMSIQDFYELYQEGGLSLLGWLPGFFGVGVQSYGKQELVSGKSVIGEPTTEIRPVQSLGETISEKLFGQEPLQRSKGFSVEAYIEQLDAMPREEASKIWQEINKTNPDLAKKISDIKNEQKSGITIKHKQLKEKGVSSGERALSVYNELNRLKTDQERSQLWREYVGKGIITEEVGRQIKVLIKSKQSSNQKGNRLGNLKAITRTDGKRLYVPSFG